MKDVRSPRRWNGLAQDVFSDAVGDNLTRAHRAVEDDDGDTKAPVDFQAFQALEPFDANARGRKNAFNLAADLHPLGSSEFRIVIHVNDYLDRSVPGFD